MVSHAKTQRHGEEQESITKGTNVDGYGGLFSSIVAVCTESLPFSLCLRVNLFVPACFVMKFDSRVKFFVLSKPLIHSHRGNKAIRFDRQNGTVDLPEDFLRGIAYEKPR